MALLPVDGVIEDLLASVTGITEFEDALLADLAGRYLAEDVISAVNVPPEANSAMDGYAVRSADIEPGSTYAISDRIPAGTVGKSLHSGTVARIFTGAEIPQGADAVIIQEDTRADGDRVVINTSTKPGKNIRPRGQDISIGDVILERGRRIRAQDVGLIASVGRAQVKICRPLRVGIMSTGDELIEPPNSLQPGQIYNSNQYSLTELVKQLGMEPVDLGIVRDTADATVSALSSAAKPGEAKACDCILSTGGVSVGEEDHVRDAVEKLGSLDIWRLAIKPGKPLAFGHVRGIPFFGLPGNPVSMFVTFTIIAKPYLIAMQGGTGNRTRFLLGDADFQLDGGSRREYMRVKVDVDDSRVLLRKYPDHGSGIMSSVSWADALAEIEVGQTVRKGDKLRYCLI